MIRRVQTGGPGRSSSGALSPLPSTPSFPPARLDELLAPRDGCRWQVLCGDEGHWRAGLYAPPETGLDEITELERHDCPELFILLRGQLTLVLSAPQDPRGVRELPLEPGRPVLVQAPHSGYCPEGPHSGVAFVIERDAFETEYRSIEEW